MTPTPFLVSPGSSAGGSTYMFIFTIITIFQRENSLFLIRPSGSWRLEAGGRIEFVSIKTAQKEMKIKGDG
jgi:hypothetical protein